MQKRINTGQKLNLQNFLSAFLRFFVSKNKPIIILIVACAFIFNELKI